MTIFICTLTGLAVVVLVVYLAIPIAHMIKNKGRQRDVAEVMYPGDRERQSDFRDKVASEILRRVMPWSKPTRTLPRSTRRARVTASWPGPG